MRSLTLCLVALSGCATMPLYPSRPGPSTGAPPADPMPAKVVVHLTATAEGLKRALDTKVPPGGELTFDLRGPRPVKWARTPFTLRFADGRVELKSELTIDVELPMLGRLSVPVAVAVNGEPIITSDWKARLQGAKATLESKDLRLRTAQGLGGVLEKAQGLVDAYIEDFSWDLSPQVREAWQKVSAPITFPVGDATACATLQVTGIEAGPTVIAGGFEKDVAFVVAPSVSLPCPSAPPASEPPRLANVATLPSGPFSVVVPIAARYDELAKAMSAAFTDGKLFFSKSYPELYLSDPEVFASQQDQLVVKLHLAGPVKAAGFSATLDGDLYFAGRPAVVDNELRIPDLEPTVQTKSFLLGLKATLDADGIRDQARAALKLDLTERFASVRQKLSSDVPFDAGLGCLKAQVAKIEVNAVYPHASYLRVYVTTTAQASVYLPCPGAQPPAVAHREAP
ncbi:MAG: DUF4403 family protein [Myxococcaceae bacterium]|nr:DUF4403 family protein [Myxococcaceae bacterium]